MSRGPAAAAGPRAVGSGPLACLDGKKQKLQRANEQAARRGALTGGHRGLSVDGRLGLAVAEESVARLGLFFGLRGLAHGEFLLRNIHLFVHSFIHSGVAQSHSVAVEKCRFKVQLTW